MATVLHLLHLAIEMEPFQRIPGQTLAENYAELTDALVNLNPLAHAGASATNVTWKLEQVLDAYREKNINALKKSGDNEEYTQLDELAKKYWAAYTGYTVEQDARRNEVTRKQNMEMQIHAATCENTLRRLSDKIGVRTRTESGDSKELSELERTPLAKKRRTVAKDACDTLRDIKDLTDKENERPDPVINTLARMMDEQTQDRAL
ncbi:hypothetical protein M427DRAFT_36451 [Gonapodya prolifera JEL478]|uniref:Uncharacterized protein n=1 Tax=Gonapodya prolifera (strain JEL478) TaxID=1344416 RepID=A0A139A2V1_GONPJ|nr:hypothetical protein M427DRAFT_36451 [Gonapodya prolifera JEL478]|eukprot:KXS10835.1 hypothetical protein M427DRAFT_36451 [Gonapodya prolifera JEL478]